MEKNRAHPGRPWRPQEDQAVAHAWHDLVETARATVRDGLVVGTSGNVSVLVTPDRPAGGTGDLVLITPTGVPYDRLGPEDTVAVGLDGRQVLGTLKPTSELPLHLAVYRTGTARAVVHTHAPHATAVSTLVDTLPPVHYMAAALGGPVRTAPYALYGSQELAGHLVEALRDRTACLLRNHGTVTTGDTLTQALDRTAQLEWMCRVWLLARSVPGHTPSLLDAGQLDAAAERLRGYGQPGG
ncbi:class II aldolase/adducin family protein [Streptomyces albidoflavus]|uniref:class II aldolase/adducin family protein n=1 Tax=Streptomyces albidoflavus TaxID=1886 RepID=UPI00024943FA|nr:class II aldolase/adducin family protein [Streptomyces albidoflavus]MBV7647748.1 class II aldolase/adducin family protein [Streptomyces albidoflavus]MBV7709205.1 class II aldolase/adducin family protein [Streptomyces albidoflavus]MCU7705903.1 class II aldolase/adducin family protein [Streptomyces albidoflavus]RZD73057.1 class II aldolase family protein [Streptomyces albidoflavus]RZD82928.1 class II aldolase family protein [Streptomyces albidoflavus]